MIDGRHWRRRLLVSGNPQAQDSDKLQSTPFNTDSFLPYNRPYMKFYKTTTSEFALSAPKCQDSFKFIANKSSSIAPGSISVPSKQSMAMESVKREQVQILTFVSYFLRTLDKSASNIGEILQGIHSSVSDEVAKEVEEMLSFLQIQFSCLNSLDTALETVIDSSMIMACNLELARRDTTLKVAASHLHEHDRNRLFMAQDLFSPSILDAIEKKLEKERSPKRQKVDHKPIFQSKSSYNGGTPSAGSSHTPSSGKNTFRSEFKAQQQQKSSYSTRGGRGGCRK